MTGEPDESRLSRTLRLTAAELDARFATIRDAIDHNGLAGGEAEKVVAAFLRDRLPQSVGVTTGEVIDSTGAKSKQIDVIVYDAMRTPMIFTGDERDTHVVPAEGVLAVVEVKSHLRRRDVDNVLANCRSVKNLSRVAYLPQPLTITQIGYGQEWLSLPIYYSVFAAKSDGLYAELLNELQSDVPLPQRIDSMCCLDRGILINATLDLSSGITGAKTVMSARSLPDGGLAEAVSDRALVHWYAMLASSVMQASTPPIDITTYLGADLRIEASIPAGAVTQSIFKRAVEAMATEQGADPDLLERWTGSKHLTLRDQYELLRLPGYTPSPDLTAPELQMVNILIDAARKVPFDRWSPLAHRAGLADQTDDNPRGARQTPSN